MAEQSKNEQSRAERVGFHKGALSTLAKERQELGRILGIVEQLMQAHVQSLKELGVDLVAEAEKAKKQKPIEDMIN
ncbi:hypothetical protein COY28_04980 [Candidatus Woesearchaeota archaeon CG_4_10_14_0_2_um_filter_57_5]|nr:MAG: hypothetical protein AUJ68_01755 [Candidatus Woesearchaeota archaeon CG1_02_57_44]PIN68363.1 MAG: hypothetical protein COV94_05025 [Candidatus Woesearchaeota archaeon CG11_big_fil_rev_8_21_14_0_20_57_5]PIZ51579.1 MAG: hypothetical protein COY28_04980 [Candidatus Woesearchaeota archaeon CG_4_10_14_0_2_um_filter_57_5]